MCARQASACGVLGVSGRGYGLERAWRGEDEKGGRGAGRCGEPGRGSARGRSRFPRPLAAPSSALSPARSRPDATAARPPPPPAARILAARPPREAEGGGNVRRGRAEASERWDA
ncbi:E3 Ubiquitin-Protein Ligase Dzip3 [Manis pentadactyla]|nr:E3 Ubiquitin-Protein Ligase Dzip3 [Manis pentadactyla]